ncbi:DUF689-domain-containing protein [Meredithblackwellia eburnea MCA 4105]
MAFELPQDDDIFASPQPSAATAQVATTPAAAATILVVASQEAAKDGSYQSLVTQLSTQSPTEKLEMQMVDRIADGATTLQQAQYNTIALLLPESLISSDLVALLYPALAPGAALQVRGPAAKSDKLAGELRLVGLAPAEPQDGLLVSIKPKVTSVKLSFKKRPASSVEESPNAAPTSDPSASTSSAPAQALPLRTSRAARASLWALTSSAPGSGASTPTIDESTLLTDADLERPTLVKRPDCDVKRTRKACKNCSCGLRELLLQEEDDLAAAGFGKSQQAAAPSGVKGIGAAVTSSCGNCYLGDAFRCGSCPFLGMPAFEPGQKVTVSGFDDI